MKTGRKPTHRWDRWIDGERHLLRHGEDFTCRPSSLARRARSHAAYHRLVVRCSVYRDGTVAIRNLGKKGGDG
jgi:hypothetical protein